MRHAAKPPTSPIMPTAVVQELLTSLAGLGFVCAVTLVFVLLARFVAHRILDEHDGSTDG